MERADKLVYWIKERYRIKLKKEAGESKPWSTDKTFHHTYFCNVHREDDKVTKWIRTNWGGRAAAEHENYILAMCLARMVNKPSTLEQLGFPWRWSIDYFVSTMDSIGIPWGNAYIVSTGGKVMPKAMYAGEVLDAVYTAFRGNPLCGTLANAHKALMKMHGFGTFMAAQVVADLKNTEDYPLREAEDWWTWCAHGPGSLRGMAWVLGQALCTPTEFYAAIPELDDYVTKSLGMGIPDLCNQDIQNTLCEFDKYMRVSTGVGRSKRRYNGV